MSGAPPLRVCIVTHQSASTIDACLEPLLSAGCVSEIVLVDNASTDATRQKLAAYQQASNRVSVILNEQNRGFSVACNQAARGTDPTAMLLFINPDARIDRVALEKLIELLQREQSIGVLSCVLYDEHGKVDRSCRRRDPSLWRSFQTLSKTGDGLYVAGDASTDLQTVDAVSGALMLLNPACFQAIGGFDEAYLLHAEDLDLCRRARQAGWRVAIANQVRAQHLRGVSSRGRPYWVAWQKHRGLWRYWRKFDGESASRITHVWALLLICGRFAAQCVQIALRRLSGIG